MFSEEMEGGFLVFGTPPSVAVRNIPQVQLGLVSASGRASAPREKKFLPLEQKYSGSDRQ